MAAIEYQNRFRHYRLLAGLSQAQVAENSQIYLFKIDLTMSSQMCVEELQPLFCGRGFAISSEAQIELRRPGEWVVCDKRPKYFIRKKKRFWAVYDVGVTRKTVWRVENDLVHLPHPRTQYILAKVVRQRVDIVFKRRKISY